VVFYVPCLATVGALGKQLGTRRALLVVLFTFVLALTLGVVMRGVVAVVN
jgi:Fe2+ transport system protein B